MLKKFLISFIIALATCVQIQADIIKNVSLAVGNTGFQEKYQNTWQYGAGLDLITSNGMGFHLSGAYMKAKPKLSEDSELTFAPIYAGFSYHFFPYRNVSPYLTALLCIDFASRFMETPIIGYGLKAGFLFRMDSYSGLFMEVIKQVANDSKTETMLDPLTINAGLVLTLWGLDPEGNQPSQSSDRNRSRGRYQRTPIEPSESY